MSSGSHLLVLSRNCKGSGRGLELHFFWLENNLHVGSVLEWILHWQKYNSCSFSGVANSNPPWIPEPFPSFISSVMQMLFSHIHILTRA